MLVKVGGSEGTDLRALCLDIAGLLKGPAVLCWCTAVRTAPTRRRSLVTRPAL